MTRQPLRLAVTEAERALAAAGVASPRNDAELLAAHVLGVPRGKLLTVPLVDAGVLSALGTLVSRRAAREPLQHLVGTAPMGAVDVEVGAGVFVPRPETELLFAWGADFLRGTRSPVVVDLCTGSGALALALANARPDAAVHAVEQDPAALSWARRNADLRAAAGDTPIRLHAADVTAPTTLTDLDGQVDLVVCNPPYVPEGTPVPPEVADHDPHSAVFSGPDGLDVIRPMVGLCARLLRPGGALAVEHDDTHGESVPALFTARTLFTDVRAHRDLAGRPRFTTAHRT
ncbi:Protein-N(5)-glutamine methyltransferase PrmC, methylates polypeptide chain release factors RF1 and RF2 [Actinokineospora spheciospongiae]|uniref:Release factor glutamine methyltransferase n=1 Tax=Actinokineospora spheciospongiae TaxID=909613 RepID=W7IVP3_9PSEU|nr:peptide chain release factor N(5)-glutamine methyltransferase [Actinokineospora spheciospongiae]EWC60491.1 Protein-N(5)-glutamine methyltransferase PrmC, methylates polypeptide chain release factors RF1 and RF2 [Actinokineospora spheciospongiae]